MSNSRGGSESGVFGETWGVEKNKGGIFPTTLGLNSISFPSWKTSSTTTTFGLQQKAARQREQEYQWCDPNLSVSPTQGRHTDTEVHRLVYDLWEAQTNCAMLPLLQLWVLPALHPAPPTSHTHHQAEDHASKFI